MEKQQNKFRFERKFLIKPEAQYEFLLELTKSGFSEIFEERTINNIYLDTYNFNSAIDNIEGISNRKKTRIRWYGERFTTSKKVIEFKIKSDDVNRKESIPLQENKLVSYDDLPTYWEAIKKEAESSDMHKFYTHKMFALHPTLTNSYRRNYYLNAKETIRVTLDKDILFYSPIYKNQVTEQQLVIEVKSNAENLLIDNLFTDFELTKYSKYVKGILSTSTFKAIY